MPVVEEEGYESAVGCPRCVYAQPGVVYLDDVEGRKWEEEERVHEMRRRGKESGCGQGL